MKKVEEYYKEWGSICRIFEGKEKPIHHHQTLLQFAEDFHKNQLAIGWIYVKEQEPPLNTEILAQCPQGINYLTSWRDSYKIFSCQGKQENSCNWKWKQID